MSNKQLLAARLKAAFAVGLTPGNKAVNLLLEAYEAAEKLEKRAAVVDKFSTSDLPHYFINQAQ